jgi:3-dehydroquinate synthase
MASMEVLSELVWRSSLRLIEELEPNLYEDKTYMRVLDFGHTFSPLIESLSNFRVTHGVAVAIDIALSSAVACELDLLTLGGRDRILRSLINAGLPIYSPLLTGENCARSLGEIEAHRGGQLNLVVPTGIGSTKFITEKRSLPLSVLQRAIGELEKETRDGLLTTADLVVAQTTP